MALAIHRREIRIGDDHLRAGRLKRLRHPLTVGPTFQQNSNRSQSTKRGDEWLRARPHAPVPPHLPRLVDHPNPAVPQMPIDGTIDHGWLLLVKGSAHTERDHLFVERKLPRQSRAAGRFISSPCVGFSTRVEASTIIVVTTITTPRQIQPPTTESPVAIDGSPRSYPVPITGIFSSA